LISPDDTSIIEHEGSTLTEKPVGIALDDAECTILIDILDNWLDGIQVARKETEVDRTVDSAEQLLDLMEGYTTDFLMVTSLKERIETCLQLRQ